MHRSGRSKLITECGIYMYKYANCWPSKKSSYNFISNYIRLTKINIKEAKQLVAKLLKLFLGFQPVSVSSPNKKGKKKMDL